MLTLLCYIKSNSSTSRASKYRLSSFHSSIFSITIVNNVVSSVFNGKTVLIILQVRRGKTF